MFYSSSFSAPLGRCFYTLSAPSTKAVKPVFPECGAFDGEELSNTLLFELERNWTGLLIEPNYIEFTKMKQKNRKVRNS